MRSPLEIPEIVRTPFGVPWTIRGQSGIHEGVDLHAPAGSWLVGPCAGVVEHYGRDGYGEGPAGNGTWLCLVPDDDQLPAELVGHRVEILCLHLSESLVIVGSRFEAGQRIAKTGYTGFVEPEGPAGAHLHLEIHVNGRAVDPATLPGLVSSPAVVGDETSARNASSRNASPPEPPVDELADLSPGVPVPESAPAPLKLHLSPSGVVGLIRDAFKLGSDLARFLPGGISADEAAQLVSDASAFASDVASLLLPTMAPA